MQKLNVSWHGYSDHLREMMHGMMKSNDLTDVTLVCDDQKLLMAHKVVLSASSPVFQNIINNFSQNNSMIYLRGIQHDEMESILEFMYLGEATFHQDRMVEFLKVAKNLEIKELTEMDGPIEQEEDTNINNDIVLNPEESKKKEVKLNTKSTEVKSQTKNCKSYNESFNIWQNKVEEVKMEVNLKQPECKRVKQPKEANFKLKKVKKCQYEDESLKVEKMSIKGISNKTCLECGKSFKSPSKMIRHFASVHQGLRPFNCTVCDKSFAQKVHLNVHMKNAHEPVELNF